MFDHARWVLAVALATGCCVLAAAPRVRAQPLAASAPAATNLVVAYQNQGEIYVRRWDGRRWTLLTDRDDGSASATPGDSATPAVAIGPDGEPVIAWVERAGGGIEIYAARWHQHHWEALGGSASGGGVSRLAGPGTLSSTEPRVAVDRHGRVVVAWSYAALQQGVCCRISVYLRRWNGTTWEALGGSASGTGVTGAAPGGAPTLAIGPDDQPIVGWHHEDRGGTCAIALVHWSGSAWVPLGGAPRPDVSGSGAIADPAMALDRRGAPVLVWPAGTTGVSGARWRAWQWQRFGDVGPHPGCTSGLAFSVAIDPAGEPIVARRDPRGARPLHVVRWAGHAWVDLGALPGSAAEEAAITSDRRGVVVAWSQVRTGASIYVARWDGKAWRELGGSAHGAGISGPGASYHLAIAAGPLPGEHDELDDAHGPLQLAGGGGGARLDHGPLDLSHHALPAGPSCPASFRAARGACTAAAHGRACAYPEGTCSCVLAIGCPGGVARPPGWYAHQPSRWSCTPKVRADGCPGAEPVAGRRCGRPRRCTYSPRCYMQTFWTCAHGRWKRIGARQLPPPP